MLYSFIAAPVPLLFELHLSATAAGTHHLDEKNRGVFFMWEEHLNCMSRLLCSDFALEG